VVMVRVAHVAAGGDEPVGPEAWLLRRNRGESEAGGGTGGGRAPAGGRGAGGEAGEAEAHSRQGKRGSRHVI
jgi:hypothetical protein